MSEKTFVLVHGYGDTSQNSWWNTLKSYLDDRFPGCDVYTADFSKKIDLFPHEPEIGIPMTAVGDVRDYAYQLENIVDSTGSDEVFIIAHSMGGLVSRYFIEEIGTDRVSGLVTLGTPHQGTYSGFFGIATPGGREMIPGNDFLRELNSGEIPEGVSYTALWSDGDKVFFQDWRARLPEEMVKDRPDARNIYAGDVSHLDLVSERSVFEKYAVFLD